MSRLMVVRLLAVVAVMGIGLLAPQPSQAGGVCSGLRLTCENGHSYPLCPIAVSEEGELVTGHLSLGPGRRGVHVRLVPMGVGYRYIGRGVWFDGLRGDATLFLGKDRAVSCAVEAL